MRKLMIAGLMLLCLSFQTQSVFAWGQNGHRIVGKITQDNLSQEAKIALEAIAGKRSLALLSTWADFVRSYEQFDCFKPWHFLTVEDGQSFDDAMKIRPRVSGGCDKTSFKDLEMPYNVVHAIDYFTAILEGDNKKTSDFTEMLAKNNAEPLEGSAKLTALALLVHYVGDVHQPLHVGKGPDRGGNTITVQWFDELVKLHALWDTDLIENEGLSYSEYAEFLEQEFADKPAIEYGDGAVTWAKESVSHRKAVYDFGSKPEFNLPRLSYNYAADNNALLKSRLYQSGMRLAELLNRTLGN